MSQAIMLALRFGLVLQHVRQGAPGRAAQPITLKLSPRRPHDRRAPKPARPLPAWSGAAAAEASVQGLRHVVPRFQRDPRHRDRHRRRADRGCRHAAALRRLSRARLHVFPVFPVEHIIASLGTRGSGRGSVRVETSFELIGIIYRAPGRITSAPIAKLGALRVGEIQRAERPFMITASRRSLQPDPHGLPRSLRALGRRSSTRRRTRSTPSIPTASRSRPTSRFRAISSAPTASCSCQDPPEVPRLAAEGHHGVR